MIARKLVGRSRIVHALDVEDREEALRIAEEVEPYVDAIKISYLIVIRCGGDVISDIRDSIGLPVIADFKVADIPGISRRIVEAAIDKGVDGLTLHGFVGRDSMTECIKTAHERGGFVFTVIEMSHKGALEFMQPVGEEVAKMACELGSDGIVTPATRPEATRRYREIVGKGVWIMSPGVGVQGGRPGDAILAGADFEVVGRRIYESPDPGEAAKLIGEEIKARLKEHQAPRG